MAIKTFTAGSVLTASDTNTFLANSGLVFVKSQTVGTGVTSVTVTNCFSSTYDNYRVIYDGGTLSANDIGMKYGPTSVAGHNTNYWSTLLYANGNPGAFALAQIANGTTMGWVGGGTTTAAWASFDVFSPFLARWSRIHSGMYQNGGAMGFQTGEHQSTGQFTDLILLGGGGATLTGGTITVYGYRKA